MSLRAIKSTPPSLVGGVSSTSHPLLSNSRLTYSSNSTTTHFCDVCRILFLHCRRGFRMLRWLSSRTGQKALRLLVPTSNLSTHHRQTHQKEVAFLEGYCRSSLLWCFRVCIGTRVQERFDRDDELYPQPVVQRQDSTIGRSGKHKMHLEDLNPAPRLLVKVSKPYVGYILLKFF